MGAARLNIALDLSKPGAARRDADGYVLTNIITRRTSFGYCCATVFDVMIFFYYIVCYCGVNVEFVLDL